MGVIFQDNYEKKPRVLDVVSLDMRPISRKIYDAIYNEKIQTEEENTFVLHPNEFLVGFRSEMFSPENAVVIDTGSVSKAEGENAHRSKIFAVIGKKGSGKSVDLGIIADYYKLRFNTPIFVIDPFGEFWVKKYKFAHDKDEDYQVFLDNFFKEFGMKRISYKTFVICPAFLEGDDTKGHVDKFFSISFDMIREIMKKNMMVAVSTVIDLLGVGENDANSNLLLGVLKPDILSWSDLKNRLKQAKHKYGVSTSVIFNRIQARLNANILTDDESKSINFLELMTTYDMVIFRGQLRSVNDDDQITQIYNSYVKILLNLLVLDLKSGNGYIQNDHGALVLIDEVDSLAPAVGRCSARETIVQLATKYRKAMLNLAFATQSAQKVDPTLLQQVNFIISSRVDDDNIPALKQFGISDEWISEMRELHKVKTSIGTEVSQKVLINLDVDIENRVTQYVPIAPLSEIYTKG